MVQLKDLKEILVKKVKKEIPEMHLLLMTSLQNN